MVLIETEAKILDIHDFVKEMKLKRMIKQKQIQFIDHLAIYIKDLEVYKVVMFVNPLTWKNQGKRVGLKELITIWDKGFDKCKLKIDLQKQDSAIGCDLEGVDKGKYLIIYDPKTLESNVYTGEDDAITDPKQLGTRRNMGYYRSRW